MLAIIDDATNAVYAATLGPEEPIRAVLALLRRVVEQQGVFCSLYTDRASLFVTTRHGQAPHQPQWAQHPTQIARALQELGIQLILAHSPQAKGRIERLFGTWQGRLPHELRLQGITTYQAANAYVQQRFLPWHNRALVVPAGQVGSAVVPCPRPARERIFALQHARTVAADNTVQFNRITFQLPRSPLRVSFAKCRVTVYEHLDETITIGFGPHTLGHYEGRGRLLSHDDRTDHVLQKADSFTC